MVGRLVIGSFLVMLLLASAGIAVGFERDRKDAKFEERLELLTMWKMMEALNLDKPTAEKIMQIRHKFVEQRKALQEEIRDDFHNLRKLVADKTGKASDDELAKALSHIRENRLKIKGLFDEQYNEVSKVLTVRQRAELVLFLKDFHKDIRAILRTSQFPTLPQDKKIVPPPPGPPGTKPPSDDPDE